MAGRRYHWDIPHNQIFLHQPGKTVNKFLQHISDADHNNICTANWQIPGSQFIETILLETW